MRACYSTAGYPPVLQFTAERVLFSLVHTADDGEWYVLGKEGPVDYCGSFEDRLPRFFTLRLPGYL